MLFASARAALRHAPPPVELPINPPQRRKGQPAIGIPPDKMAAFLNEMKTVRLRKVSENGTAAAPSGRKDIYSASFNGTARNAADPPKTKHSMPLPSMKDSNIFCTNIGDKRKRDMSLCDLRDDLRELIWIVHWDSTANIRLLSRYRNQTAIDCLF